MGTGTFGGSSFGSGDSFGGGWSVGDPINAATGNKYAVQFDYLGAGPFPLRFQRYYNSLHTVTDLVTTELGTGWRGFYDSAVALQPGASTLTARVVRPDGKSLLFTQHNDGSWSANDPAVTARLASLTDAYGNIIGWTYTTHADITETYNRNGRLVSIANRAGLTQTLAYDINGNLSTVTDPFGRKLAFTYDAQNHLIQMTDPLGGQYAYAYDGNHNLISVSYPDGTTRTYLYENAAFLSALTGIVDENGSRYATWTYNDQGRAVSSVLAGGVQAVSLTYNGDGTTTVTDARGMTRVHAFQNSHGAFKGSGTTGSFGGGTLTRSATYDANGFLSSRTDLNGNVTSYVYNDRGLLASRTDAVGTPQQRTVSFAWHPVFHLWTAPH